MEKLVVATPSRGLLHSRTVEAVLAAIAAGRELIDFAGWVFSHDLPIPECHERVCERALAIGADLVWLVEEDMMPPANAVVAMLKAMMSRQAAGAFIDYPIGATPTYNCAMRHHDGTVIWCGTGCLLLRREAFERLAKPWFRNDHEVEITVYGDQVRLRELAGSYEYGGQDIWFTVRLRQIGMRIAYVPPETAMCQHLEVTTWGQRHTNAGVHTVALKPMPERWC